MFVGHWLRSAPAGCICARDSRLYPSVTFLVVGLDRSTLAPWHRNVLASDLATATRIARSRAAADGIQLVVAAVIGPNSSVLAGPLAASPAAAQAA